MPFFQSLFLGIIQGLTEFLPVSSSGHLILTPILLGWHMQSLAFDVVLHLGTASALLIYFWKDLYRISRSPRLIKVLLIGSIPAGVLGYFLEGVIENVFRSELSVVAFLLAGSLLMLFAEIYYKKVWDTERQTDLEGISYKKAFTVGLFQALALFSGVSRSGATISGGMLFGLKRELAARFSFILSIPIVVGAGLYKIWDSYNQLSFDWSLLAGFFGSFIVGMLAINILLRFLKSRTLYPFIIYRLLLVVVLFLFSL